MSSPERIEMLAIAVQHLVDAMRIMDANQAARDVQMQEMDARYDARIREINAQIREGRARVSEIIGVLTEMQSDIARLDAAS